MEETMEEVTDTPDDTAVNGDSSGAPPAQQEVKSPVKSSVLNIPNIPRGIMDGSKSPECLQPTHISSGSQLNEKESKQEPAMPNGIHAMDNTIPLPNEYLPMLGNIADMFGTFGSQGQMNQMATAPFMQAQLMSMFTQWLSQSPGGPGQLPTLNDPTSLPAMLMATMSLQHMAQQGFPGMTNNNLQMPLFSTDADITSQIAMQENRNGSNQDLPQSTITDCNSPGMNSTKKSNQINPSHSTGPINQPSNKHIPLNRDATNYSPMRIPVVTPIKREVKSSTPTPSTDDDRLVTSICKFKLRGHLERDVTRCCNQRVSLRFVHDIDINADHTADNSEVNSSQNRRYETSLSEFAEQFISESLSELDRSGNMSESEGQETGDMIENFYRRVGKIAKQSPEKPKSFPNPALMACNLPETPGKALVSTTIADNATIVTLSIVNSSKAETLVRNSPFAAGMVTSSMVRGSAQNRGVKSKVKGEANDSDNESDFELSDSDNEKTSEETDISRSIKKQNAEAKNKILSIIEQERENTNSLNSSDPKAPRERLDINIRIEDSQYIMYGEQKRWQCTDCTKSYTTKHNLVTHILGHSGIKPHMCIVCNKYFKQLSHLNTHMLTHEKIKPHVCSVCNKCFTQVSHLKRHEAMHMDSRPYICDLCGRGFTYPSELRAHKEKHIPGRDKCSECGMEFNSAKLLKEHLVTHETREDLKCSDCDRHFKYPSQLKDHLLTHTGRRPYMCTECGMDFMKEHHLRAHLFTHTGVRPYECEICHRRFNQKANMQRHMLIHNSERPYACTQCTKTFTQPQTLKAHMVVHSDRKPYSCEICGKEFGRLHNLQGHMHLHNGSKPYSCFCGSTFTLKGNLCRHKKVKHGISDDGEDDSPVSMTMAGDHETGDDDEKEYFSEDISIPSTPECQSSRKQRKSTPRKWVRADVSEDISPNLLESPEETELQFDMCSQEVDQEVISKYYAKEQDLDLLENGSDVDPSVGSRKRKRKAANTQRKIKMTFEAVQDTDIYGDVPDNEEEEGLEPSVHVDDTSLNE